MSAPKRFAGLRNWLGAHGAVMVIFAHVSPMEAQHRGDAPYIGTRGVATVRVATRDSSVVLVATGSSDSFVVAADPAGIRLWADQIRRVLSEVDEQSGLDIRNCEGYEGACIFRATLAKLGPHPFDIYVEGAPARGRIQLGITVILTYPRDDTLFSEMGPADLKQFIFSLRQAAAEADSMRAESLAHAFEADCVDRIPVLTPESDDLLSLYSTQMGFPDGGVLEVVVTPEGAVESASIRLIGFSYPRGYEQPLISDVKQLRFSPGERDGERVRVRLRIPLGYSPYFRISGSAEQSSNFPLCTGALPAPRHSG